MYIKNLTVLATLVAAVLAAPSATTGRHVVHEKRDVLPSGWSKKERVEKKLNIPVRIALTQSNLDRGHDELMKVSDPTSADYGKHWSLEEITDFFAPSQGTVDSVKEWLVSAGIDPSRISQAKSKGWLHFNADVSEVEELLQTKYHYYEHSSTGAPHVACDDYKVPDHVQQHIDFISPTLQFDQNVYHRFSDKYGNSLEKRGRGMYHGPFGGQKIPAPGRLSSDATSCSSQITPSCLRTLYQIPKGTFSATSYGIVEYAPEAYLQSDLNMFFSSPSTNDAGVPNGTAPSIVKIDGGYLTPSSDQSFEINGESDLDLQYAMTLVYPQKVTLFQVGDNGTNSENISFNNFLDALDASYCTYDGGDTSYDESFPDPGGYEGKENCGTATASKVISTSYSMDESNVSPSYVIRQCHEYMKLGMAGTSFLYSSGDYGVAGNGGQCIGSGNGKFNPTFPGTCPYVTSVGATQLPAGASPTGPETACETVIYSGGGFSNVFALPSYQSSAVASYYKKYNPPYGASQYNNSQKVRGFPDVSANGANYVVAVDGEFQLVYGTSASSPVFGSIITLLNNQRAAFGQSSLGFLNPVFYKNPQIFNDITNGTNQGCGTNGFSAVPGWDPVTGLGTPNYKKMLAVLGGAGGQYYQE